MAPIDVVTTPLHRRHDPPYELNVGRVVAPPWERPERMDAIEKALRDAGHPFRATASHDDRHVAAVHDPEMVAWLRTAHAAWVGAGGPDVLIPDTFAHRSWRQARYPASPLAQAGWWCTDTATPLVAGSYEAVRAGVDAALTAADMVADGAGAAYALCRPPGHHAGRDHFGGFCVLNMAAIAAERLTAGGRVAMLDVDYHHGNGSQDIFWERDDVLYVSLHADAAAAFPYLGGRADEVGAGRGRGHTRNLPLPPDTTADSYLDALGRACEVVDAWGAATLLVSLGVDTHVDDPIAGLGMDLAAYHRLGAVIRGLGLPTVLVQEGGYDLDVIGANVAAVLSAFTTD